MLPIVESSKENGALQVCLAEYAALRAEVLAMIRWRQTLTFASIASSGAVFSFALSPSVHGNWLDSPALALYLVAPICALTGALWIDATWGIHRISSYLTDVLSVQVNSILHGPAQQGSDSPPHTLFLAWESSKQRNYHGPGARFVTAVVFVGSFICPGVIGQILIMTGAYGSLIERIPGWRLRIAYSLNWLFLFALFGIATKGRAIKNKRLKLAQKHWLSQ